MTRDAAIQFLKAHQPMPPTRSASQLEIDAYDEVRKFLLANPSPEILPLVLNSFGEGDLHGVYASMLHVFNAIDPESIVDPLIDALRNGSASVKYWCAQIAMDVADERLVDPLIELVGIKDRDIRFVAVGALAIIATPKAVALLQLHRKNEDDPEILEIIDDL